jgi:hypothetical protein
MTGISIRRFSSVYRRFLVYNYKYCTVQYIRYVCTCTSSSIDAKNSLLKVSEPERLRLLNTAWALSARCVMPRRKTNTDKKMATSAGFEPTRGNPKRFLISRLNRSARMPWMDFSRWWAPIVHKSGVKKKIRVCQYLQRSVRQRRQGPAQFQERDCFTASQGRYLRTQEPESPGSESQRGTVSSVYPRGHVRETECFLPFWFGVTPCVIRRRRPSRPPSLEIELVRHL